jgi:hypothetical protein
VWSLVLLVLGSWPGVPSLAQTLTDPRALRFSHAVESRRAEVLGESRSAAAGRLLAVARELLSLPEGAGHSRTELLGQAQYLADSIALLEQELGEAAPAAREVRRALIRALEGQLAIVRQAAENADLQRRPALEARVRDLETELDELREMDDRAPPVDPLSSEAPTLISLARLAAEENVRLRALRGLQDDLRLFMGNLRLFDETGMPPSVRAEGGGDPDPGGPCPITCPLPSPPPAPPADLPMEHFRPEGLGDGDGGRGVPVTPASLGRLQERLATHAGSPELPAPGADREGGGAVARETQLGAGLMAFRRGGSGLTGVGFKVGTSFLFSRTGGSMQLTVEPWLGARSVQLDIASTAELAGEVRETLVGTVGGGRLRWQMMSWQKGRFLSETPPLPAYLDPGRKEGGLVGRAALAVRSSWDLEMGGGGDAVRYGPEEWRVLDRQGLNASLGLARQGRSGSARLTLAGSRHEFVADHPLPREDTRLSLGADWSLEGRVVVRLSAGLAWNDSRVPAYDARSSRGALALSVPWRGGSIQAYSALAHQTYTNPGPEDERAAPSDQDTGSILALQLIRPMEATRGFAFRAEWSRSETGFRNDFYQRFGAGVHVTFRGLGGF